MAVARPPRPPPAAGVPVSCAARIAKRVVFSFLPTSSPRLHRRRRRPCFSVEATSSGTNSPPINADYLETEFSGHGASFESIGESCAVKMSMRNGSTATLMLPAGLITSYKPRMWHGATLELLHTTVEEGESGEAVVRGGASPDFMIRGEGLVPWTSCSWHLRGVGGSPTSSIQVELASVPPEENTAEIKWLVTLDHDSIGLELIITNRRSSAVEFSGSFINHLKVSTPDASYVAGIQGSNYRRKRPISTRFSIIPPDLSSGGEQRGSSSPAYRGQGTDREEGEEVEDYAHMTEKMSRIYTNMPRQFTMIDRGRRNSVVVGRRGFDEFYMLSPGAEHESYGNYAYLCIGASAMLQPVRLEPGRIWRGANYLCNPNL